MKVTFNLKEIKSIDDASLIILYYFNCARRYKYSTGKKVEPKYWNQKDYKVTLASYSNEVNEKLALMDSCAVEIVKRYDLLNQPLSNKEFILEMDLIFKPQKVKKEIDSDKVLPAMVKWFENLKQNNEYQAIKSKGVIIARFREFISNNNDLKFNDITLNLINDFEIFLLNDKGYAPNYIASIRKNFRIFLRDTWEIHKSDLYKEIKHTYIDVQSSSFYLSRFEVDLIRFKTLSEKLQLSRDWFIVQCFTSLKYSDLDLLNDEAIKIGKIEKKIGHTGRFMTIPIHPIVKTIFDNYDSFPVVPSNYQMNKDLKEIAKLSQLHRNINDNPSDPESEAFVWDLISTETGRHTALHLMYGDGISFEQLIHISGHSSVDQLRKYMNLDPIEIIIDIEKHHFFRT